MQIDAFQGSLDLIPSLCRCLGWISIFQSQGQPWSCSKILKLLVALDIYLLIICAMVKSRYIGDGHPTFKRNPYNGYINPYYYMILMD